MSKELIYQEVYFTSLEDVERSIKDGDVDMVCRSMPAVGMDCQYNLQVKRLIEKCLKSDEEWIRRSGLMCLYFLHLQFRGTIYDNDFNKYVKLGCHDNSKVVKEMAEEILAELREFFPAAYKSILDELN